LCSGICLSFAQKVAIAQRRFVCVTIAGNSLSLATGTAATCGTPLASPSGGGNYVIDAQAGVTVTDASFHFKALGSPSAGVTVSVTGGSVPLIAVSAAKIVVFSLCSLSARAAGAARNANNAPATTSAANHVSFRIGVFG